MALAITGVRRFLDAAARSRRDDDCDLCFREQPAVADVSREVNLSPDHFGTVFRQATGRTFVAHVQQRRVEEAKVLLTTTRKSITEICLDCGFTNLTHFNRVFRRWTKKSPRQYRKESPTHAGGVCTAWTDDGS